MLTPSSAQIGAVYVSQGWIHPPLIGGDIGCGMAWFKTRLSRSQVEGDEGRKIAEKLRGLEGVWRTQKARDIWLENDKEGGSCSAGEEWDPALGTVSYLIHYPPCDHVLGNRRPFLAPETCLLDLGLSLKRNTDSETTQIGAGNHFAELQVVEE